MNLKVDFQEIQENNSIWNNNNKVVGYSFLGMSVFAFFYAVKKHYNRIKILNKNALGLPEKNDDSKKSENIKDDNSDDLKMEKKIEKIIQKIKNSLIHTTIICIDRMKNLGATNSNISKKEDNNEDIVIEDTPIISDDTKESNLLNEDVEDFLPEFEKKMFSINQRKSMDTMNRKYYFKFYFI